MDRIESVDEYIGRIRDRTSNLCQSDRIEKLLWVCLAHLFELNDSDLEDKCAGLLAALEGIKSLLGPEGEYAICKADGTKMWLGDDMIVGGIFEKADAALARARGEENKSAEGDGT